jgi:opacity protein-like surface antigen
MILLRIRIILISFLLLITIITGNSYGQILEVFAMGQQMSGDNTTGLGKQLEFSNCFMGGVGAGLNIENFNLNMDFLFGSEEIKIENTKLDTKLFLFDVNLDYSFFNYSISPIITAGLGSVNFSDSFVKIETLSENDFSYNAGFGLKVVLSDQYLLKGIYRATWTKIKDTDNVVMFNGMSIMLGYIF